MQLKSQRRIAAELLKVGENKIWFSPERLEEIKKSITKADIRHLINELAIQAKPSKGVSRFRARKLKIQKSKGRRKGSGSRKGKRGARITKKQEWMSKVRVQRLFIKELKGKDLIGRNIYHGIYLKVKGGFFRSRRHIKLYLSEHNLFKKKK
ncbi:MAG: 50S ribosomal protein L19e [Candidatus Woesearchaeota archaeon]